MISPTINLQVVNFIEQFLAIRQGFSSRSVCSSELHCTCSLIQNFWKLLFLFLSHTHTLSLFQKTAATAGNSFHIFCTCIWCLFKPEYTEPWFWCL